MACCECGQHWDSFRLFNGGIQALEEGEDLHELTERAKDKKERRATNKLLKDADVSGRATPNSDTEVRSRKVKKGKGKMNAPDYEPTPGAKRKCGLKSMSVTPSVHDDDDDERDMVRVIFILQGATEP